MSNDSLITATCTFALILLLLYLATNNMGKYATWYQSLFLPVVLLDWSS